MNSTDGENTMEKEEDNYTKDGTVDYRGNPANKKKTGTWKACPYILGTECCERLAYYGMSSNLVLYFKHRLNQQSATASKNQSDWAGTCYITPLIGAFLADSYLGRYWTIACFSTIYIFGMTLLTLSASVPGLRPACVTKEDCHPTHTQSVVTFLALYLIALGTGGIKPCVSSYGADQFDDADEGEKNHKSSFFNWFYFSINIGALIASSVLVWVQDNVGWNWGFGIPTVTMALAVASFFSGTRLYRNQKPGGSPLTRICQVIVASVRKCHVKVPEDKSLLYETADAESAIKGSRKLDHTKDLSFFDKAAVEVESNDKKSSKDPWSVCTVTQAEELKAIVRLLPIWATGMAAKRDFDGVHYVVFVGKVPGVYDSWIACSEQVNRFSGAAFKKYRSLEEANNAWTAYAEAHSNVQLLSPQIPEIMTDYPPLLVPVEANMNDDTPSKLTKHCVYIAILLVGVVIGFSFSWFI